MHLLKLIRVIRYFSMIKIAVNIYMSNKIVQRIAITGIYMVNLFDFFFYKLREQ